MPKCNKLFEIEKLTRMYLLFFIYYVIFTVLKEMIRILFGIFVRIIVFMVSIEIDRTSQCETLRRWSPRGLNGDRRLKIL